MTLARRKPLKRTPMPRSRKTMSKRRTTPRRRPEGYADPDYLLWLTRQTCPITGHRGDNIGHHLRHDERGRSLGKNIKDDRRAITMEPLAHVHLWHAKAGMFATMTRAERRAWENEQLARQRAEYLDEMGLVG